MPQQTEYDLPGLYILNDHYVVQRVESHAEALALSKPVHYVISFNQAVYEDRAHLFGIDVYGKENNLVEVLDFSKWIKDDEERDKVQILSDGFSEEEISAIDWAGPNLVVAPSTPILKNFLMSRHSPTTYLGPVPYASFETEDIPTLTTWNGVLDLDVDVLKSRYNRKYQALELLRAHARGGMEEVIKAVMLIEEVRTETELLKKLGMAREELEKLRDWGNFFALSEKVFPEVVSIPEEYLI